MTAYSEEWYYPTGGLATNQRAIVFGPGDDNVIAPLFTDETFTVPLPNPTTTDALGILAFSVQVDGLYWIWVGPTNGGHGVPWNSAGDPSSPVLTVNGEGPDGLGNVQLSAADVGADPAGSAAAAAAASQPLATIDAKGDIYAGTANNTTTRLPVGADGEVLFANSGTATGLDWAPIGVDPGAQQRSVIDAKGDLYVGTANDTTTRKGVGADGTVLTASAADPTGVAWVTPTPDAVDSVNGQTGVVVLDAGDVGADPAGSAAAAAAASQPLATIDAKGDLYAGTAADTTTRLPVGANGQFLRANSATGTGLEWDTVTAGEVGADPAGSAAAAQAASQPLDTDLTEIAALSPANDDLLQQKAGVWTNRTVAQVRTDLNVNPMAFTNPTAGVTAWYSMLGVDNVSSATDIPTGDIRFVPFFPAVASTLTRLATQVTRVSVAAAGTDQVGFGLYSSTGTYNGRPTGAPLADFGLVDLELASLGVLVLNPTDVPLTNRLYWLAAGRITSGTVTTSGRIFHTNPTAIWNSIYHEIAVGTPTAFMSDQWGFYSMSGWAGGAMPSVGSLTLVADNSPAFQVELTA